MVVPVLYDTNAFGIADFTRLVRNSTQDLFSKADFVDIAQNKIIESVDSISNLLGDITGELAENKEVDEQPSNENGFEIQEFTENADQNVTQESLEKESADKKYPVKDISHDDELEDNEIDVITGRENTEEQPSFLEHMMETMRSNLQKQMTTNLHRTIVDNLHKLIFPEEGEAGYQEEVAPSETYL